MYQVTYFDLHTLKNQTETFGMIHIAIGFAKRLKENGQYRVLEVLDRFKNREIEV